jgi:hypothetical protein
LQFCFVGSTTYSGVAARHVRGRARRGTWNRLAQSPAAFVGDLDAARRRFGADASQTLVSRTATFTLCPAGHARWTFRLSEALRAGSIPVLLSDYYRPPLSRTLHWDRFSVSLPESSLWNAPTLLRRLPPERVRELQLGVREAQLLLQPRRLADLIAQELDHRRRSAQS